MKKEPNIIIRSNTPEGQMVHFIERLFERYGIKISEKEYNELCVPYKVFHGAFSKNRRKTIGWIYIKGEKVWVLRDGELQRLATVYPPSVEFSDTEMIRSCFGGAARAAAMTIYRAYKRESEQVSKIKFDSIKDAALYFFSKTRFAPLHIDKYKHGSARTIKVSVIINKILCGTSEHTELVVRRKKPLLNDKRKHLRITAY